NEMQDATAKLTSKQEETIAALLAQPAIAAATVGVNPVSIYRWLQEPAFAEAYHAACREVAGQAIAASNRRVVPRCPSWYK
ncbi:MAG TPA: hypothetical protein VEZ12_15235, partial [Herpetosiphonaceae bacterium]|nr:hypothetical protein [Herpetosiphonaceae bacterium]